MGGYKKHDPTVYVVKWPDGVVKVGYSEKQRWRKFALLGAEVVALYAFPTFTAAFEAESWGQDWLKTYGRPAFAGIPESRQHVGRDGGGYKECYTLNPGRSVDDLVEHMLGFEVSNAR